MAGGINVPFLRLLQRKDGDIKSKTKKRRSHIRQKLCKVKNIIYTGHVSDKDLDGLYRGAKIYAFPSLYEGFGIPPLEAMVRGLPVAAAKYRRFPNEEQFP